METSPNFNPRVGIEMPFMRVALLKDCLCNDFFIQERKKTQSADYKFLRSCILSTKSLSYLVTLKNQISQTRIQVWTWFQRFFSIKIVQICVWVFNDLVLKLAQVDPGLCIPLFFIFLIYPKFFLSKVCMWLSIGVRVPIFSQPYANNMQEMQKTWIKRVIAEGKRKKLIGHFWRGGELLAIPLK